MAGLMAAHHLTRAGRPVIVFEARDAIGGRIKTILPGTLTSAKDVAVRPIELGAEFVHGAAQPTLSLAETAGVSLERVADAHSLYAGGKFRDMGNVWGRLARVLATAKDEPDESVADFLKRRAGDESDVALLRSMVEGFDAAPLDDASLRSIADEAREANDDSAQFRPASGYGVLAERLLAMIDPSLLRLHLDTVVEEVEWKPGGDCTLRVSENGGSQTVQTKHCVVTVPIGVLNAPADSGAASIRFSPKLASLEHPLSLLAMGHVVKVVLSFRHAAWMAHLPKTEFFHFADAPFPTFWHEPHGAGRLITAWAGGPKAKLLDLLGPRDLLDQISTTLAECCGVAPVEIREALIRVYQYDFSADPFAMGAYPYARPGGADAWTELAEPIENALFFAGDATCERHFGTVAGALASGARAARQILALP
jgi:monoamine oxidase